MVSKVLGHYKKMATHIARIELSSYQGDIDAHDPGSDPALDANDPVVLYKGSRAQIDAYLDGKRHCSVTMPVSAGSSSIPKRVAGYNALFDGMAEESIDDVSQVPE